VCWASYLIPVPPNPLLYITDDEDLFSYNCDGNNWNLGYCFEKGSAYVVQVSLKNHDPHEC
jgi:hypothetical protein